ncbi:MAG: polysaccharide biosynthesis tyrosine autokinase [Sedimentisphaerales bacterium]
MNMIEKHQSQHLSHDIAPLEVSAAPGADPHLSLITPILRRWHIVLITFLVICAIGIPAVWLLIKPMQAATAAIRVAPIIPSILFSDKDSEGVIPMYTNFVNTQADLIMSDQVLQRVADDLVDKNLRFFKNAANPVIKLREALINEDITVATGRNSELIKITMKSRDSIEAAQIVDAFVKAYMAIEVSREAQGGDQKLAVLEDEHKVLTDKLERIRQTIHQMAEEYGSTVLTDRQEIMLKRVADIQTELTTIQTRKITLETQQQLGQQGISPDKLFKMRYEFINADPTVQVLSINITELDQGLIVAKQTLAPANPELQRKTDLLEALKARLEERRQEMGKTFDEMMSQELAKGREDQLANIKAELEQVTNYEKRLEDMLAKENTESIELGRKHLAIQDQQEQLEHTKELYDTVGRRIQELEMERKRPARISVAYNANVAPLPDKRLKYTAALIFASLAAGCFLAFLRDKADYSLYTPDDITKRIGIRIIGTTTSADYVDMPKLPQQVVDDYQTIRANLGLLNGGKIPNKLVITSAGIREGKTTFSINLATSLAKAGKKILLVDGDLRKPDIRRMLNLPEGSGGLQDVLLGKSFEDVVHFISSGGFDILTADSRNASDGFELLSLPDVSKYLNLISAKYDHVIIDSPPVLACPDALLWAKIADGVILISFAGYTEEQGLKETLERLAQIKVRVLGTVLNNVRLGHSYYRYGYNDYANGAVAKNNRRKSGKTMLLLSAKEGDKTPDNSKS